MKLVANCSFFGVKKVRQKSQTIVALVACKVWNLCDTFYTKKEQMKSGTLACKKCETVQKKPRTILSGCRFVSKDTNHFEPFQ
jgi:hypothetical protein